MNLSKKIFTMLSLASALFLGAMDNTENIKNETFNSPSDLKSAITSYSSAEEIKYGLETKDRDQLEWNASDNNTYLSMIKRQKNNLDKIHALVKKEDAPVNDYVDIEHTLLTWMIDNYSTYKHGAEREYFKNIIKSIINHKYIQINKPNLSQETALYLALSNYHDDIAALLILKGAKIDEKSNKILTPLHRRYLNKEIKKLKIK